MSSMNTKTTFMKRYPFIKPIITIFVIATGIFLAKKLLFNSSQPTPLCPSNPASPNEIEKDIFLHRISHFRVSYSQPGLQLYIYGAFLDERYEKNVLRIFALEEKGGVPVDFKCKYSLEFHGKVVDNEINAKRYWIDKSWPDWSPYFAVEYNCAVPKIPGLDLITFLSADHKYNFVLPVERPHKYKAKQRQDIAVCTKPLSGYMGTAKLVEWFETLKAVGYKHMIIYQSDLTGPGRYILDYYEQIGLVTVINFPYLISVVQNIEKPGLTDEQRFAVYQQIYLIAMHDCLYRFSYMYKYIAFVDTDEIIVPLLAETMSSVLNRAEKINPDAAGFMFQTVWHWEDFGATNKDENLYMQKYRKSTSPSDRQPKSIISTDRTLTFNFHEILDVPKKHFKSVALPPKFGMVHHFRGKCKDKFNSQICKTMLKDVETYNVFNRYKDSVKKRVKIVTDHLQMK